MATITNASLAVFSGLAGASGSQTAFTYLAVGTGTTSESAAHTALVTEVAASGLSRAAATVTRQTTTQTNDTLQLVKAFTVTGTVTIAEVGMFNASSSGVMAAREKLSSAKSVVNGDSYTLTFKIIFA